MSVKVLSALRRATGHETNQILQIGQSGRKTLKITTSQPFGTVGRNSPSAFWDIRRSPEYSYSFTRLHLESQAAQ